MDQTTFARKMTATIADTLAKNYNNYNFNLAKAMASIAMNEGDWGRAATGDNNFYGIKDSVNGKPVMTKERDKNGVTHNVIQKFKNYKSFEEGAKDFVRLLMNKYSFGNLKSFSGKDIAKQMTGYFTADPEIYANTIHWILNGRTFVNATKDMKGPLKPQPKVQNSSTLKTNSSENDSWYAPIVNFGKKVVSYFTE